MSQIYLIKSTKIFLFSLVGVLLLTGCNAENQKVLKAPIKPSKINTLNNEESNLNIKKEDILKVKSKMILEVDRSPVRIMRSIVMPYTSGDKAIGIHTVDLVIDFGNWNTSSFSKPLSTHLGGLNE
jgi:hypothetical protein